MRAAAILVSAVVMAGGCVSVATDQCQQEAEWVAREVALIPDDGIAAIGIGLHSAQYAGACACPHNTDENGVRCGDRSAYSQPGGAAVLMCYPREVVPAMYPSIRRALTHHVTSPECGGRGMRALLTEYSWGRR